MRVLIVADTLTNRPANPFVLQLIESLVGLPLIRHVSYGVRLFFWQRSAFDVIHFQWPEVLFDWTVPTTEQLNEFAARLAAYKQTAAVVTTIHNLDPHPPLRESGEMIFERVYSATDAFIHLSDGAKNLFIEKYGDRSWCRFAPHHVLEHGDYVHYTRLPEDDSLVRSARKTSDTRLLLVFGALRSVEEEEMARTAFQQAAVENSKLVFAGNPVTTTLPPGTLKAWRENIDPNIVRHHMRIPDEQVAPLVKASRFLFIPRTGRINSGVIPLAFTFGTPVIAPDEALSSAVRAVGGSTYIPGDSQSAAAAIRTAFAMGDAAYGELRERIRAYRKQRMQWAAIGRQHEQIYAETLRSHPGRRPIARLCQLLGKRRGRADLPKKPARS